MRINGHLHMLSVVECSTQKARSKGCCFGRSFTIFVGSLSTWDYCLMSCTTGGFVIRFSTIIIASLMKSLAVVLWFSLPCHRTGRVLRSPCSE